jgi:microcystin-dependent protein
MGNLSALGNTVVQTTPVGVIEAFAGVNAPAGWLFCDGSAVSRIQYPELFSALSTTYGSGDGSTTFNIPDLRGRMPFGKGTHSDVSALGNNEGASLANRRPKHQHTVYDAGHTHTNRMNGGLQVYRANVAAGSGEYGITSANTGSIVDNSTNTTGVKVNPEGASSSTSPTDAPPYLVVNYIIKAVGDLPRGGWFYQNQPPVVTQYPSNPQIGEEVYYLSSGNLYQKRYDGSTWQDVGQETVNTARLSGTVANANLPDGAPVWVANARSAFPNGSNQTANVSVTVPYKSEVMIMASASAFGSTGLARTYIAVYGVTNWVEGSYYYFNVGGDHRTTPTAVLGVTLNAGTYSVGCLQNFNTDVNDQATFMFIGRKVV